MAFVEYTGRSGTERSSSSKQAQCQKWVPSAASPRYAVMSFRKLDFEEGPAARCRS